MADQGISELRKGAVARRYRISGSGKCFDAPQHILVYVPYVFIVRVENKIHMGGGEGTRLVHLPLVSTILLLRTTNPGNIY